MYAKFGGYRTKGNQIKKVLKPYHHIRLDQEFKSDCRVWLTFLMSENLAPVINRPMIDLSEVVTACKITFYSDASAAKNLGFGCILDTKWIFGQWESGYISRNSPSIEYLELFALTVSIFTWTDEKIINNCRVIIFCDNQAVVSMINNMSSNCPNCMHLLRLLVLSKLQKNRRIFAKYVSTKDNYLADSLSRLDLKRFRKLGPKMNPHPDNISPEIWPASKLWKHY